MSEGWTGWMFASTTLDDGQLPRLFCTALLGMTP